MIPFLILVIEDDVDREFMIQLYLDYNLLMYSEAKKIVTSQWDAEEVVQTVVEKLIHHIDKLKSLPRDNRINYIISAVKHTALKYVNKDKRLSFVDFDVDCIGNETDFYDMDQRIIDQANQEIIYSAWKNLTEKEQWILQAKYVLDMTNEQIALSAGVKPDSVRTLLCRARNSLRREFDKMNKD